MAANPNLPDLLYSYFKNGYNPPEAFRQMRSVLPPELCKSNKYVLKLFKEFKEDNLHALSDDHPDKLQAKSRPKRVLPEIIEVQPDIELVAGASIEDIASIGSRFTTEQKATILLHYYIQDKTIDQTAQELARIYRDDGGLFPRSLIQRWFNRFCLGNYRTDLDDPGSTKKLKIK